MQDVLPGLLVQGIYTSWRSEGQPKQSSACSRVEETDIRAQEGIAVRVHRVTEIISSYRKRVQKICMGFLKALAEFSAAYL